MTKQPLILLLSGGLDSVTMLYDLCADGVPVHALLFDYGQKHWRELHFAKWHCGELDVLWTEIQIDKVFKGHPLASRLVGGSGGDIVHNRNMVLLSIACSISAATNVETVAYACNKDDAASFPDCRPAFVKAINESLFYGSVGVEVVTPYILKTKREIVALARKLKVPIEKTWSCYEGESEPCEKCEACRKREEALG